MGLIELPKLDEGGDFTPVEPGEVELEIKFAELKSNDKSTWISVQFCPVNDPEARYDDIYQNVFLPNAEEADAKRRKKQINRFQTFLAAFNVDTSSGSLDTDDLVGKTGWALTGIEKDPAYPDKATVKKFIVSN